MTKHSTLLKSNKRIITGGIFGALIVLVATLGLGRAKNAPAAATAGPYTYTFDGAPASPQSAYWMADFDVQVHARGMFSYDEMETWPRVIANHGSDCDPMSSHDVTMAQQAVFQCRNHFMTAAAGAYSVIYFSPNRLLDWSDGEASLSIDVSTFRTSGRDWWDLWLTEWDANAAVPLSDRMGQAGVDLNGPPQGDFLHLNLMEQSFFKAENENGFIDNTDAGTYSASDKMQRDPFVLTINATTFSFCKPDESLCWFRDKPHGLSVKQAVVTYGHHAYDPAKSCLLPNCWEGDVRAGGTWHWDNLAMSDSVPVTILRGDKRVVTSGPWSAPSTDGQRTVNFPAPAPAGSYLKFSANSQGWTTINGQQVQPEIRFWSDHFTSFLVPIPEGTTSIVWNGKRADGGDAVAKDFTIWSKNGASSSVGQAPAPATPTNTPVPAATSTPIVTATATATTTQPSPTTTSPTATPTTVPASQLQLWSCGARIGSAEVRAGQSQSVQAYVATNIDSRALVDVEIYDPTGTKVYQRYWDNRDFNASQTRNFFFRWKVPANAMKGTYTVKIGIFNPGWAGLLMWNNNAATFQVK